jgi:hypothetical protein
MRRRLDESAELHGAASDGLSKILHGERLLRLWSREAYGSIFVAVNFEQKSHPSA